MLVLSGKMPVKLLFFHLKPMAYVAGFCYSCFHPISVAHFYTSVSVAGVLLKERTTGKQDLNETYLNF